MSQVIRAQYRAVIQKEAVPEKTEQAFAYWEEQLKKILLRIFWEIRMCWKCGRYLMFPENTKHQKLEDSGYTCIQFSGLMSQSHWIHGEEHRNRMGGADGLRCCTLKSYFPMYATIRQSLRKACWWEIAIR